jgi:hypothetical protein
MNLAGGTALIIRRLIVPLALAFVTIHAGQGFAQGAFPAPLPGQAGQRNDPAFPPVRGQAGQRNDPAFPPVSGGQAVQRNDPAFPPVNGAAAPSSFPAGGAAPFAGGGFQRAPSPPLQPGGPGGDVCMQGFMPLREEAEKRGKLIKAASDRHAPADEACKLIENFAQAEIKMMKYVEANSAKCGIPAQIQDQLKSGHKNTEIMQKKVCSVAQQQQQKGPAGPSLSEVLGSSTALPEASTPKKGGSAFDTLTGNVLTR